MEINKQASHNTELVTEKEMSMRKLLNVLGLLIFGGLALSILTTPPPSHYINEFLLFIFGSAITYYFLANLYFIEGMWRKVFFKSLILLCGVSIFMIFYLVVHPIAH